MKRLYVAFILIALSLALCLISSNRTEKYAVELQSQLTVLAKEIKKEDSRDLKLLLDEVTAKWNSAESLFSFIVDADKIEQLSIGFEMVRRHLYDGNKEHALERLHECGLILGELTENEKLNIKNIM